jgi:hypothetical protein
MSRYLTYLASLLRNRFSNASVIDASSGVVVSLTSHSVRIKHAFAAIESIGDGSLKPARLILYLGRDQDHLSLPSTLKRLVNRGLEIRFCDDVGPHTKYYPHLIAEPKLELPLVTADDDTMMSRAWLATLVSRWRQEPEIIHCFRAREIRLSDGSIEPYKNWPLCQSDQPSIRHFATGVSGVIYPPAFQNHLKNAKDEFQNCCPRADDIWLHVMALRHSYRIRQISTRSLEHLSIPGMSRFGLRRSNVDGSGNDDQIKKTYNHDDVQRLLAATNL